MFIQWVEAGRIMASMAVAIVNYNTCEQLRACLATVQAEAPGEVVVVDNASSDGSVEMVQALYPWAQLHPNKTNFGYGAAANQAISSCTAKYVLLLNSDTRLSAGALQALADYMDSHQRAAVIGPRLANPDGTLQASCYPFPTPLNTFLENSTMAILLGRLIRRYIPLLRNSYLRTWPHTSARVVPWVKGAVLVIRRKAFDAVGGFDESYFMYFEDADLCYRLNALGWQVHFAPVTTVVHVGGASTLQWRTEMAVQLLASTLQFYQRHTSRLRLAEVVIVIRGLMLVRWISGAVLLAVTRDPCRRAAVRSNMAACRRVLLGDWRKTGDLRQSARHQSGTPADRLPESQLR
jgi:N-acetylglucosaminyl-diphospho-decaprenol L-rhamnosyltransferase